MTGQDWPIFTAPALPGIALFGIRYDARRFRPQTKSGRNAAVLSAFDAGETLAAIGERHGLTRERVRQIVTRAGREPRRIKIHLRSERRAKAAADRATARKAARGAIVEQAVELIRAGASVRKAAMRVGLGENTLHRLCRERGLASKYRGRWSNGPDGVIAADIRAEVERLALEEPRLKMSEISRRTGVHYSSVMRFVTAVRS